MRRAGAPVENVAKSFHDDYMKKNAEFRSDAGLKCYINRVTDGKCCEWCNRLAGRYVYGEEPHDVFRRHDNCGCTVTYECGRQRQDVWSKKSWEVPQIGNKKYKPTVFANEQAKTLEKKNLQYKGLTGDGESGIIKENKPLKIDMQFFSEKDIEKQESSSLKRAMRKYKKRIEEHEDKINNPKKYIPDWESYDERKKQGLKKHWQKEISNFNESIDNRIEELKKRGDYDE